MTSIKKRTARIVFKLFKKINRVLDVDIMRWHNSYFQAVPDRYANFINLYKQSTNFMSFSDLEKWNKNNWNNNIEDIARFFFLNLSIDMLLDDKITGDVAELGVYKGNSAYLLSRFAQKINSKCFLFDTYEGFDAQDLTGIDKNSKISQFADTSLKTVKSAVGDYDGNVYVKGYFPDSLSQIGEQNSFCLVHIDCDLEKPFTAALEYFYPRMVKGGFLIMHDYANFNWPGAKVAVDHFFKDKPEFVIPIPDKSGTAVIRKV